MIALPFLLCALVFVALAHRERRRYLRDCYGSFHPTHARGEYLDTLALHMFGLERIQWRSWRTLWFWRRESDAAFRARLLVSLQTPPRCDTGKS